MKRLTLVVVTGLVAAGLCGCRDFDRSPPVVDSTAINTAMVNTFALLKAEHDVSQANSIGARRRKPRHTEWTRVS